MSWWSHALTRSVDLVEGFDDVVFGDRGYRSRASSVIVSWADEAARDRTASCTVTCWSNCCPSAVAALCPCLWRSLRQKTVVCLVLEPLELWLVVGLSFIRWTASSIGWPCVVTSLVLYNDQWILHCSMFVIIDVCLCCNEIFLPSLQRLTRFSTVFWTYTNDTQHLFTSNTWITTLEHRYQPQVVNKQVSNTFPSTPCVHLLSEES